MGQSYVLRVLPTVSVRDLKAELAHRANWNPWQIDLFVCSRLLAEHELVEDLRTQDISAVIRS
jgi:hypothetical protein